jgi:hypothetical protein
MAEESPMHHTKSLALCGLLISISIPSVAQHDPAMHSHGAHNGANAPTRDMRQSVEFSQEMRDHTLTNMRDHLLALQEIQYALSKEEYDQAGDIAEQRLGMTALIAHGSYERAVFMPQGMRDVGSAMHSNASRFGLAAKDAAATGDVKPALAALSNVVAQCVACHAAYRVK